MDTFIETTNGRSIRASAPGERPLPSHSNISKSDWSKLNRLFGHALVYESVCQRLVEDRDPVLLADFGLSPAVQAWMKSLQADSLPALAEVVFRQRVAGS